MQDHPSTTGTATRDHSATMFVALELSRRCWLVAIFAPHADKVSRFRLPAGATGELLARISGLRDRAERRLGKDVAIVSVYEAGWDGFWLHRLLTAHGITSYVIDPTSIQIDRRARRIKTDAVDVAGLLRSLMAWCRGEARVCSMVRVPSVADEDARRLSRERGHLVKERIRHSNRIKGLCATQGIYDYEPLRADRRDRLAALGTGDGRPLPLRLTAEIGRQLVRLELVLEQLAAVEAERDHLAKAAARDPQASNALGLLMRLKSIGPEFATVLTNEVFYRRFDNRRQVGAYAGLTPSLFASGAMRRDQGISKAGNRRVRKTMVELAWLWLRNQPDSALSQWFLARVGDAKGRVRRIAIVALARKLLVALWRYTETGVVPDGAVLKA